VNSLVVYEDLDENYERRNFVKVKDGDEPAFQQ
jgi:hypothetical protein